MHHVNGRGIVADHAEARPAAYIDINSKVLDRARAHSGRLVSSTLAIEARFSNATAIRSTICCDEVTGGRIVESFLGDQVCCWDSPTLFRVTARDGARVYGNTVLLGPMTLYGDMRILAGVWHRAPRFIQLDHCYITEGPPGWVMIDCKFYSYAGWLRVGPRFASRHYGWSVEQVQQVRKVLLEWSATEDLRGKHWGACVEGCTT